MEENERRFEQDIETYLLSSDGGYIKGNPQDFDRECALNKKDLFAFIENTQKNEWDKFKKAFPDDYESRFIKRFNDEVVTRGIIDVIRNGIKYTGAGTFKFKLAYFMPETNLNPEDMDLYNKNILNETRQLKYSTQNENSIDIVLLLNGIPVVALELKNQITGQNSGNAQKQFMYDRDPRELIFRFNSRIVAYFAVDHYDVKYTTKLAGKNTYYLPFNQGSNGAGNVGGAGNPTNENGYTTDYLWKNVLKKDSLMEIILKFVHLQVKEEIEHKNGKEIKKEKQNIIFPRFHQLDVVRKLIWNVRDCGVGHNYLIQHSAGSGKSNSIAWLAHRLSGLHDRNNNAVFNSIIVVTDRKVLDKQLQETIYQFEHQKGVVVKIDDEKTSKDLKEAINDGKRIIITTLQKFPVIYKEVDDVSGKKFAVIVDEAHSSQTGNSAKKLKIALADRDEALKKYAEMEAQEEENEKDYEDKLVEELATHGHQDNISFFAFTATPKAKTLELFGTKQDNGTFMPYHVYSMRQAIEEGFILDVLANYMTYKTIYQIAKKTPDNPEVPENYATRIIKKFESLHEINISQKTQIIVEQFRNVTKNKINGKGKAMLVTASRLHAVRYFCEMKRYIQEKGYDDLDVLVAFSGEVKDGDETFTESNMNKTKSGRKISESQTKEYFHGDEFNVLVVAEKYQTGFDEPLLHTMFVDKKLKGIKAVQTLSRLNRTYNGKDDTLVIDFVNEASDIQEAFKPFYDVTVLEHETDPNVIYDKLNMIKSYGLIYDDNIEKFCKLYLKDGKQSENDFGKLTSCVKETVDLYNKLDIEDRENFRKQVISFNKFYSYITQITFLGDEELHKTYMYLRYVEKLLPKNKIEAIDLEGKLKLTFYNLKQTFNGSVSLRKTDESEGLIQPQGSGIPIAILPEQRYLEEIIKKVNDLYAGQFTEADNLLVRNIMDIIIKDEEVRKSAKANNEDMFVKSVFPKVFSEKTSKAYKESASSYKKLFESKEFYNAIMKSLGNVIYRILNSDDTIKYSERSEEDSNTELKVTEDSEEYKITDKEDENG